MTGTNRSLGKERSEDVERVISVRILSSPRVRPETEWLTAAKETENAQMGDISFSYLSSTEDGRKRRTSSSGRHVRHFVDESDQRRTSLDK